MEIPYIDNYPKDQHQFLEEKVRNIIIETYVLPADSDYLLARFCSLNFLYQAFFWPALQTVEKYLKANLLFHGVAVRGKGFSHDIVSMAKKLENYDDVLKNIKLTPHDLHIELQHLELWGAEEPAEFLERLRYYGDPSNRYNYFGSDFEASLLLKLDQIVFALRSNIVSFDLMPKIKKNEILCYFLYEQNIPFAPDAYNHQSMYGKIGINMSVPSIEAALKGVYGNPEFFEKWIENNIPIRNDEIEKIKNR